MPGVIHLGLSVRGALRWPKRELRGLFQAEDGSKVSADQAREHLMELLANGVEMLPVGACPNFDDKDGCMCSHKAAVV